MASQKTEVAIEGGELQRLAELFEACKNGDLDRAAQLNSPEVVNAQDVSGRKSTPLHFAAGMFMGAGVRCAASVCIASCCTN